MCGIAVTILCATGNNLVIDTLCFCVTQYQRSFAIIDAKFLMETDIGILRKLITFLLITPRELSIIRKNIRQTVADKVRHLYITRQQSLVIGDGLLQGISISWSVCRIVCKVRAEGLVDLEIIDVTLTYLINTGIFGTIDFIKAPLTRGNTSPMVRETEDITSLSIQKIFTVGTWRLLVLILATGNHFIPLLLILFLSSYETSRLHSQIATYILEVCLRGNKIVIQRRNRENITVGQMGRIVIRPQKTHERIDATHLGIVIVRQAVTNLILYFIQSQASDTMLIDIRTVTTVSAYIIDRLDLVGAESNIGS